jgi:thiamine-phosphate pyrophosphorylase
MALTPSSATAADRPPAPRLYLVTPPVEDAGAFARQLDLALDAADVAAVLLRLPDAREDRLLEHVRLLAPPVQSRGTALILDGHPMMVARAGADGAHLTGVDALRAALPSLKPHCIAGAGGLDTRHDAMLAGEAGADYVMFGEPDGGSPPGGTRRFDAVVERVAWWAELFEVPCVGYAARLEEVATLAAAGADFVALGDFVFSDSPGPSAMIREAAALLSRRPEPVK